MATISSHVLDAVAGRSATGVRVNCNAVLTDGRRETMFAVETDGEGRIAETIEPGDAEYELEFHTGEYFAELAAHTGDRQIVRTIVVRITMPDPRARYHVPVMASPHSYSVWWSA